MIASRLLKSPLFKSIGFRIFLAFSTLILSIVTILGFTVSRFASNMVMESANNQLRVLSITLANQVQRHLNHIETDLGAVARDPIFQSDGASSQCDSGMISGFLDQKLMDIRALSNIAFMDDKRKCLASTNPDWASRLVNKDVNQGKFTHGFYFINLAPDLDDDKELILILPVTSKNQNHGTLLAEVRLSRIYDLMDQKLGLGDSGDAFLLDGNLRFITPGRTGPEMLEPSHLSETPLLKHMSDEFWVGMYENYEGEYVLGTAHKIPSYEWYLVIERDYESLESKTRFVTHSIEFTTAILTIIVLIATFYLTRYITRPISSLVKAAQLISAGDLDRPVDVPKKTSSEIAFLAREFENMRSRLLLQQNQLKKRLKESELRVIQNERLAAIGTMAASIAHEIRNPLNAMSLLLAHLELKTSDKKSTIQIDALRSEIQRLDQLISTILDYAKPLDLNFIEVEIDSLIREIKTFYEPVFIVRNIKFSTFTSSGALSIRADRDRLKQALLNIVQNAIDVMPHGGEILVKAVDDGDGFVSITLTDTGPGLTENARRRMFELFFTTKSKGTGLGLSTVRKIVDAHNGDVTIEDSLPHGATVRLRILKWEASHDFTEVS